MKADWSFFDSLTPGVRHRLERAWTARFRPFRTVSFDDCLHDVLLQLAVAGFVPVGDAAGYVWRVLLRHTWSCIHAERSGYMLAIQCDDGRSLLELVDRKLFVSPLAGVKSRTMIAQLPLAMRGLTPMQRKVIRAFIHLNRRGGCSNAAIADLCNARYQSSLTADRVKVHLSTARHRLREAFAGMGLMDDEPVNLKLIRSRWNAYSEAV